MVRKIQKAKAASVKPSTSVKKATKTKKETILTNGNNKKVTEKTSEMETDAPVEAVSEQEAMESDENVEPAPDIKNEDTKIAEQEEPAKIKDSAATEEKSSTSRKRKEPSNVAEKEAPTKTKSKKRKVLLTVPRISSVSGKVFVVGDNAVGQLGFGEDIAEKRRPALLDLPHVIVDIAAGGMHSVCLTESGEVITFGCNDEGALGRPTTEEGSECIPQKVDIPERIVQISAGDSHSAALSESGQVYVWGNFRDNNGPIGLLREDTKQPLPIKTLDQVTIVKIASGSDHLTCLSDGGVVYTCGSGIVGQLGRVSEHASVDGGRKGKSSLINPDIVSCLKSGKPCVFDGIWTGAFSTFLSTQGKGTIYAFGLNNFNQLGVSGQTIWKPKEVTSFGSRRWTQINGGQHHTLALDNNGLVYSLGRSEYGRLGQGENSDDMSVPTSIPSLEDKNCIDISCGNIVSFALADNGSAYSWGMGTNYQLGHGNEDDQYSPKLIEGNFLNSWKAFKISGGGQHTLILAHPRNSLEEKQ